MSVMRQRNAEHMTASRRTSAHVTSFFEIDMSRVAELRERNKARFQEDSGVKLTYMPFIISALVAGVKEWPILNASVWDDKIVFKRDINVGIAVALPQERGFGLIVPVIRQADGLSLVGLARATNDLLAVREHSYIAKVRVLYPVDIRRCFGKTDEKGIGVKMFEEVQYVLIRKIHFRLHIAGSEYAARHRQTVRHENQLILEIAGLAQMLCDLGNVLMGERLVCVKRVHSLRVVCIRRSFRP